MSAIPLQTGRLSKEQTDAYWRDGFLHPISVLTADEARTARGALERIEKNWLTADLPQPLNTYKRVNAHVVLPFVADLARHTQVLDVVEGVLGPDILIYAAEFFIKEPKTTSIVSMHQDLTYWGLGAIDGLVTAWIALSPATVASGCMDFVKGSHKNPILPHEDTFDANNLLSRGQEVKADIDENDKSPIILEPGQMSLHHGLTIHGSGPNVSDDRRIACVVRYIRPDMKQSVGVTDYVMQARGEDRFGHFQNVAAPKADFDTDSLEIYDDIRAEQAKIIMKGATAKNEKYS